MWRRNLDKVTTTVSFVSKKLINKTKSQTSSKIAQTKHVLVCCCGGNMSHAATFAFVFTILHLFLLKVTLLGHTDDVETSITEIHHENEEPTVVNGYQEPGSYVRPIIYPVKEREQFDEFVDRSYKCEQYIRYKCWNSRLLSDAGLSTS